MPTHDLRAALAADEVRDVVAAACYAPEPGAPELGKVGLEAEAFPVRLTDGGAPAGRVPLTDSGAPGTLSVLGRLTPHTQTPGGVPLFALDAGTQVTCEPGGQVEVATAPWDTAAAALAALDRASMDVAHSYAMAGATLAAAGVDVWHPADSVTRQLETPRYSAMAAYLARRGPAGRTMMCHTASLQVNLCLGPPSTAGERWLVANLLAPLLVATFAASPVPGAVSGRGLLWRQLDPTRTGLPARSLSGSEDPVDQLAGLALSADVLLVRTRHGCRPGTPGRTFGDWLRAGGPAGWPTAEDLRYHLTTLFPEVRARGFLELRGVDALPRRWRAVPVVLLVGALYDARARQQIRGLLERHRATLSTLLDRAVVSGVADPAMCAQAVEAWSLALAGGRRLPVGYVRDQDLRTTETFLDHFTMRGRCPADELAERLADSPAAALAWAGDPIDTLTPL
ncbi:MAG: glutamate-cysteine ligase family protein [Egibacteraceae bacterium]